MSCYQRIACLSAEAVETLYALGAEEHIAGISGFTTRPARARSAKPKISGFTSARLERILAVRQISELISRWREHQAAQGRS